MLTLGAEASSVRSKPATFRSSVSGKQSRTFIIADFQILYIHSSVWINVSLRLMSTFFAGTLKKPVSSCCYPQRAVWTLPSWPGYGPCTSLPRRPGLKQERRKSRSTTLEVLQFWGGRESANDEIWWVWLTMALRQKLQPEAAWTHAAAQQHQNPPSSPQLGPATISKRRITRISGQYRFKRPYNKYNKWINYQTLIWSCVMKAVTARGRCSHSVNDCSR